MFSLLAAPASPHGQSFGAGFRSVSSSLPSWGKLSQELIKLLQLVVKLERLAGSIRLRTIAQCWTPAFRERTEKVKHFRFGLKIRRKARRFNENLPGMRLILSR